MRASKTNRAVLVFSALLLATAFLVVPLQGQRIIGFRYTVVVNNASTLGPNTVVNLDGRRITLDDGRILELRESEPLGDFQTLLKDSANRVRYGDNNEVILYTQRQYGFSGTDRPESNQLITIPLIPFEFPRYADSGQFLADLIPPKPLETK